MARSPKRNASWFTHASDLRNWPEVIALRNEYGAEGYGIFSMLLEVLSAGEDFRLRLGPLDLEVMACDMGVSTDLLHRIIKRLEQLEVLIRDEELLGSAWVDLWMEPLVRKRESTRKRVENLRDRTRTPKQAKTTGAAGPVGGTNPEQPELPLKRVQERYNADVTPENTDVTRYNPQSNALPDHTETVQYSTVQNSTEKKGGFTPEKKDTPVSNDPNFSSGAQEPDHWPGQREPQKEKSSAQKEKGPNSAQLTAAQELFLQQAEGYVWGADDARFLPQLLTKLQTTITRLELTVDVVVFLRQFLNRLPKYWRTQKFTIPLLNLNYNQIVGEVKPFWKQLQPAKPKPSRPPPDPVKTIAETSPAERQRVRDSLLEELATRYLRYLETGTLSITSFSLAWMQLTRSGWLEDTPENRERWQQEAKARIKERWEKRAGEITGKEFRTLLQDFDRQLVTNKASKLEDEIQKVAVREFFAQCKEQEISAEDLLKTLLNPNE